MKDNTKEVQVLARKKSTTVKHDGVSVGGKFVCDEPECEHFTTDDYNDFENHVSNHVVKSGNVACKECGTPVEIKSMKNKPTGSDVKAKLVFHENCENEFFERRGFKKQ